MAGIKRYPNLDLLRLFAAGEVFAIHVYNLDHPGSWQPYVQPVPLFVCLSGFLIPGSFERSTNWWVFAWKRACRVLPAFLAALVLTMIVSGSGSLAPTLVSYATMGLVAVATGNGVLWSLSVEEVLYGFHAGQRSLARLWRPELVLLLFAACAVCATLTSSEVRRILEACAAFFLGNAAYLHRDKLVKVHWLLPLASGLAIFWSLNHVPMSHVTWEFGSAFLCLSLVLTAWRMPQLQWRIPDFSYGVYIYHWPFLILFAHFAKSIRDGAPYALGATIGMAVLSWYLIEAPALRWKDRPPIRGREPALVESTA